jgi:predicted aspartyl protease
MAPKIMATIFGQHRSVDIEAIIDTGFTGALFLPMDVAKRIGAVIAGWGTMELADGRRARAPMASCEIELLGERYRV